MSYGFPLNFSEPIIVTRFQRCIAEYVLCVCILSGCTKMNYVFNIVVNELKIALDNPRTFMFLGFLLFVYIVILLAILFYYIVDQNSQHQVISTPVILENDLLDKEPELYRSADGNTTTRDYGVLESLGVLAPTSIKTQQELVNEVHFAAQKSNNPLFAARCIELLDQIYDSTQAAKVINHQLQPDKFTPFHRACMNGDEDLIKYMIHAGADINITAATGDSPIYMAVFGTITNMHDYGTDGLQTLLAHGAKINVAKIHGYTPLLIAAKHGHMEVVRLLVTSGADTEAKTTCGKTAYELAFLGEHVNTANYLRVNLDDDDGDRKMSGTCRRGIQWDGDRASPVAQDLFHDPAVDGSPVRSPRNVRYMKRRGLFV